MREITFSDGRGTVTVRSEPEFLWKPALIGQSFALAEKACRAGLDVRRQGSAALDLCSVAAGRAGVYFELQVSLWDYAAGALIVAEAGGQVACVDGSPLPWRGVKTSILAASPENAAKFRKMAESEEF